MQLAWIEPQDDFPTLDVAHLQSAGVHYQALELEEEAYQPTLDVLKREVEQEQWRDRKKGRRR